MLFNDEGRLMVTREVHSINVWPESDVSEEGTSKSTEMREVQLWKARVPMEVIEVGIVIERREMHLWKASATK